MSDYYKSLAVRSGPLKLSGDQFEPENSANNNNETSQTHSIIDRINPLRYEISQNNPSQSAAACGEDDYQHLNVESSRAQQFQQEPELSHSDQSKLTQARSTHEPKSSNMVGEEFTEAELEALTNAHKVSQSLDNGNSKTKESKNIDAIADDSSEPHNKAVKLTPSDFTFHRTLGEGSYARVMLVSHKTTGQQFACKIIDKQHIVKHKKTETAIIEKQILSLCNFPHIIKLYHTFQDSANLYYILELAEGGDIFTELQSLQRYPAAVAQYYTAQLVLTLEYLHKKAQVAHRDIKPENLMLGQ
jgi:hypothetical protein